MIFRGSIRKNNQVSNLMKIRPLGYEMSHAAGRWWGVGGRTDGRTDRHDKANSLVNILLTRLKYVGNNRFITQDSLRLMLSVLKDIR
jgi:hypothetical protein